jgi:hypothetical protein
MREPQHQRRNATRKAATDFRCSVRS